MKQTIYQAFGMRIASEVSIPEMIQAGGQAAGTDAEIVFADLTGTWNELEHYQEYYAFKEGQFLFHVPGVAIFCIREGRQILVSPEAGAEEKTIRLYLLGTCMGALLMQRRILPLHGSAVAIDGKAYAFVGDSGAGKSTLAAAFIDRGYPLLSDDVIAVSLSDGGCPVVAPAYPQQKLWEESLVNLGMETGRYSTLYLSKYAVPVSSKFYAEPIPLAGVFELVKTEEERIEIRQIQGLERFPLLQYHTFRNFLIPKMGITQWHFTTAAAILSRIAVNRLRRPGTGFTARQLVDQILSFVK